ncbi:unnamed protein product [Caenorhabditis nigoni]
MEDSDETTSSKKCCFDFSEGIDSELYDGILEVEGRRFYIDKKHLARHSEYFKNLFFKNYTDSKKEIIRLEVVVPADAFQHFLELIGGGNRLNDDVIEGVLKISAMWFAEVPLEKAKKYLLNNSKLALREKFAIAENNNLNNLKISLFSTVQTSYDLESLLPSQDVSQFQPDTIILIAKKALKVAGIDRPRPQGQPHSQKPVAEKEMDNLQEELRQARMDLKYAREEDQLLYRRSPTYVHTPDNYQPVSPTYGHTPEGFQGHPSPTYSYT